MHGRRDSLPGRGHWGWGHAPAASLTRQLVRVEPEDLERLEVSEAGGDPAFTAGDRRRASGFRSGNDHEADARVQEEFKS